MLILLILRAMNSQWMIWRWETQLLLRKAMYRRRSRRKGQVLAVLLVCFLTSLGWSYQEGIYQLWSEQFCCCQAHQPILAISQQEIPMSNRWPGSWNQQHLGGSGDNREMGGKDWNETFREPAGLKKMAAGKRLNSECGAWDLYFLESFRSQALEIFSSSSESLLKLEHLSP